MGYDRWAKCRENENGGGCVYGLKKENLHVHVRFL